MLLPKMTRTAAVIALSLGLAAPAWAADVSKFDPTLIRDYIASFDVTELSKSAKREAMEIAYDPSMSHFDKVLMLHTLMETENALRHVPMHRSSPTYAGLNYSEAGV